jgi:hypothetical protein
MPSSRACRCERVGEQSSTDGSWGSSVKDVANERVQLWEAVAGIRFRNAHEVGYLEIRLGAVTICYVVREHQCVAG